MVEVEIDDPVRNLRRHGELGIALDPREVGGRRLLDRVSEQAPCPVMIVRSHGAGIDWIFGSSGMQFHRYVVDRSALVRHTTDHPVVLATAS